MARRLFDSDTSIEVVGYWILDIGHWIFDIFITCSNGKDILANMPKAMKIVNEVKLVKLANPVKMVMF